SGPMRPDGRQTVRVGAILLGCVAISDCATFMSGSHDYAFGVTMLVVDERGNPVPEAIVSLTTGRAVFEAVTPVTTVDRPTDSNGGCVFMYIAHQPSVTYRVRVEKDGFLAQELTGVAAPYAHLKVELVAADGAATPVGSGALQNTKMQLTSGAARMDAARS